MRFGNYPSYHICKTLGLIPKSCFSLLWDQSQLQPVHDIGTDPKTLFFITLGSIPTMDCTWHWDWSQSPIFWPLGLIPMWHLDSAKSREISISKVSEDFFTDIFIFSFLFNLLMPLLKDYVTFSIFSSTFLLLISLSFHIYRWEIVEYTYFLWPWRENCKL